MPPFPFISFTVISSAVCPSDPVYFDIALSFTIQPCLSSKRPILSALSVSIVAPLLYSTIFSFNFPKIASFFHSQSTVKPAYLLSISPLGTHYELIFTVISCFIFAIELLLDLNVPSLP